MWHHFPVGSQISALSTQKNTPPALENQSSHLGPILSPKVRFIWKVFLDMHMFGLELGS